MILGKKMKHLENKKKLTEKKNEIFKGKVPDTSQKIQKREQIVEKD